MTQTTSTLVTNVMLDLETMGKGPEAAIVSIGAVEFGLDAAGAPRLGGTFYRTVNLASSAANGGKIDADTVIWWLGQVDDARLPLLGAHAVHIRQALTEFNCWVASLTEAAQSTLQLWGNGAGFDNVILRSAYHHCDMPPPWRHWNDRCWRTVRNENRRVPAPARIGTHHNALDDAMHQARHLCAIWAAQSKA